LVRSRLRLPLLHQEGLLPPQTFRRLQVLEHGQNHLEQKLLSCVCLVLAEVEDPEDVAQQQQIVVVAQVVVVVAFTKLRLMLHC
jgi:hypothetical protein